MSVAMVKECVFGSNSKYLTEMTGDYVTMQ